jgi:hypothetical protein
MSETRCGCIDLPDYFYLSEAPNDFEDSLEKLEWKNWYELFECKLCGCLWTIDAFDKYVVPTVFKVKNRNNWPPSGTSPQRKELLLHSRGGTTDEDCIWQGCKKKRVKGVVYCIDHFYETGIRK